MGQVMHKNICRDFQLFLPWMGEGNCPFFGLLITSNSQGLTAVDFIHDRSFSLPVSGEVPAIAVMAAREFTEYMQGERKQFSLPLSISGTDFQRQVWQAMTTIDYGKTATYREIAVMVGGANKARAVGMAANRNALPIIIPCHRVLGSNGKLVGYDGGLDVKEFLLCHETALHSSI